ncbi:MAG TPA: PIN domain nuclease [Sporichthyaceae bacterium]|nr:PIN domain nuclease [Sporichthyaceae bacterium]
MLLADTSAWHRSVHPQVLGDWTRSLERDEIATTSPARLEILFSARSADDCARLSEQLDALHQLPCGEAAWARASEVQGQLARQHALHHRRVKIPDLIIAAVAELSGAVVWHYDEDYERIAVVTGQDVAWIAPRGSL